MNTIGLIIVPWLCGLATVLTVAMLRMLVATIRAESVPATPINEKEVVFGGIAFHWPGKLTYLLVVWPYTWPAVWLIGLPLFSFLRWWL